MKSIKYFAIAFLALASVSCEELGPEEIEVNPDQEQEFVIKQITLEASKGDEEVSRIYIGEANSNSGTTYHWNKTDEVGVFALNSGSATKNYEGAIQSVSQSNKNLAYFVSQVEYAPAKATEKTDLFIYWPYNSSNVVSNTDQEVADYLKTTGVQIRTLSQQNQSVFAVQAGGNNATEHPSVNISKYGAAFDMTTANEEGKAHFELHHATAYLQFNLFGDQSTSTENPTNYGNGKFEVTDVTVRLGKVQGLVQNGLLATGATFTPVQIAGNFSYNIPEFSTNDVSYEDVKLLKSGGDEFVQVTLDKPQTLDAKTDPVPVFAVINASNITESNVNAIEAVVTLVERNDQGVAINSVTRTRYINVGKNVIKGGDYYTIKFNVNDPVQEATALDAIGGSNCYIVSFPGKYLFHVNYPGNGVLPAHADYATLGLDDLCDSDGKFFTEDNMGNYEMRYLWASGTSFEQVKTANPSYTADQVVAEVVDIDMYGTNVMLDVKSTGSDLNGNLVVALCEADPNNAKYGSAKVIWSWHIWFGRPNVQYYNFPSTRPSVGINNEHWYMLDRNIGAETAELGNTLSYGLYYQLGRHTPFITPSGNGTWPNAPQTVFVNQYFAEGQKGWGVESIESGNSYLYARPMTMNSAARLENILGSSAVNIFPYSWVASDLPAAERSKTFFDPCPLGYKLPTTREWDNFKENEWERTNPRAVHSGIFGYGAPYNVFENGADYINYVKTETVTNTDTDGNTTTTTTETGGWSKQVYYTSTTYQYREDGSVTGSTQTLTDSLNYDALIGRYGDVAAILNARYAAGDRFTHEAKGRTYYSTTLTGGVPTKTYFPNTGVITVSGTTATATNIDDTDGKANFALWAAGRLGLIYNEKTGAWENNVSSIELHWFGPMDWYNVSFAPSQFLDWTCYMPWHGFTSSDETIGKSVQKAYGPIGTRPYEIGGIDGTWGNDEDNGGWTDYDLTTTPPTPTAGTAPKNSGNYAGQAAPVRCIREYNSTSATAE